VSASEASSSSGHLCRSIELTSQATAARGVSLNGEATDPAAAADVTGAGQCPLE